MVTGRGRMQHAHEKPASPPGQPPAQDSAAQKLPGILGDPDYQSRAEELLAELGEIQEQIRNLDPSPSGLGEQATPAPTVLQLIHHQYRLLRELRQRQETLRQSLRWIAAETERTEPRPPLVQRVSPPQQVDVLNGAQWVPAQLEGWEIVPNGQALVRFARIGLHEALGPPSRVAGSSVRQRAADTG